MKFSEVVQRLGAIQATSLEKFPERDPELSGIQAITNAEPAALSYVEGAKFSSHVGQTPASALILPMDEDLQHQADQRGIAWAGSAYPRLAFAHAIGLFYQPFQLAAGIHPTAVIDPTVQIGDGVAVGAHVVIQTGVKIGDGVSIHPNSVIYPHVLVGDRTLLHANCVIHERTQIGADCVVHSGAVIGAEGFGFVPVPEGWVKMEQSGHVVLEDGVEVGCNSAIDRPALGITHVGQNTKIDNLVHIAHGCEVGPNCALAGQVGLSGAVKIGSRVMLDGKVGINHRVTVGDGAIATAGSGVAWDVAPSVTVSGSPALPRPHSMRSFVLHKRLPDLSRQLRQLQLQVADLQKQIELSD